MQANDINDVCTHYIDGSFDELVERQHRLQIIEGVLRNSAQEIALRTFAFLQDFEEPETLHKMRVSIRRARSLLRFCAPFLKKAKAARLQEDLRFIVIQTSYLRELDVLYAQVAALSMPDEGLLSACASLRAQECRRVLDFLYSESALRALQSALQELCGLRLRTATRQNGIDEIYLPRRFFAMCEKLDAGLANIDKEDAIAVHRLRKYAKRLRYVAEYLAEVLPSEAAEAGVSAEAAQDSLGALCDARVNLRIIGQFPKDALSAQARCNLDELSHAALTFIHQNISEA